MMLPNKKNTKVIISDRSFKSATYSTY